MRKSIVIAVILAVAAAAWILSGQLAGRGEREAAANGSDAVMQPSRTPLQSVRVRAVQPVAHPREIVINGRSEESRKVVVRAETAGPVREIGVEEGRMVEPGDAIARIDVEDRKARLAEAEALVKQREMEYRAASELSRKGFRSDTKLAEARAFLDAARARVESIRIDIGRTTVRAPFGGVLETRYVEQGDYVKAGDNIASIVDLDPILAVGFVSERNIGAIGVGAEGAARFINGHSAEGVVRYVAKVADPDTRSFRIEIEIPNAGYRIRAGLTGELRLPLSTVRAFLITPAVLALADDGRIGVRIVDEEDIVRFVPIRILDDTSEGLWVSGMQDGDRLITVGHEYVAAGQKVRPVPEAALPGS